MGPTDLWKVLRDLFLIGEASVPSGTRCVVVFLPFFIFLFTFFLYRKPQRLRNIFLISDCQISNEDYVMRSLFSEFGAVYL